MAMPVLRDDGSSAAPANLTADAVKAKDSQETGSSGPKELETLGPSKTPIPTETLTPTITPTPMYVIAGRTVDAGNDHALSGAVVRLYRGTGGGWTLLRTATTGSAGTFAWTIAPIVAKYKLTEQDPAGFYSVDARLPDNVDGIIADANTIEFWLPTEVGRVGDFVFRDAADNPTLTPTPTRRPTRTQTPRPTPFTPEPDSYSIVGKVVDGVTHTGVTGAVVRLYRSTGDGGWILTRDVTTTQTGRFFWEISPIMSAYLLKEHDPVGYLSSGAEMAPGVEGTVTDRNTILFQLPEARGEVGVFYFYDVRITPTPTSTGTPPPSPTPDRTSAATPPTTVTATPSATDADRPTPTRTLTATVSPTPESSPTATRTPTATPLPVTDCYASEPGDLVYRVDASSFRAYKSEAAADSPLRLITSPPAPFGWERPGFLPDESWQPASVVTSTSWSEGYWDPFVPGAEIIGLLDASGEPERVGGTTHLIRREIALRPPQNGMRIVLASLEMWSDNKAAWWWNGVLLGQDREAYSRLDCLVQGHIAATGGEYTLAVQNSNDLWKHGNPQGTAYRLCVEWAYSDSAERQMYLPLISRRYTN